MVVISSFHKINASFKIHVELPLVRLQGLKRPQALPHLLDVPPKLRQSPVRVLLEKPALS